MIVAVTGATGHIGANLVRLLVHQGYTVRALVRRNTSPLEGVECEHVIGDLLDEDSLKNAFAGASIIFHLGGIISLAGDPKGTVHNVNVNGTKNVTKAAIHAKADSIVLCSSIQAFSVQPNDDALLDEDSPRPDHTAPAYDRSKWQSETIFFKTAGDAIKAVCVNPTGVIGPHDFGPSRMGQFFLDLASRRLPLLVKGGADWVDIRDVCGGLVQAATVGDHGHNYILSGEYRALDELSSMCSSISGAPEPMATVPLAVARLGLPFSTFTSWLRNREPAFTAESLRALENTPQISNKKATRLLSYSTRPLSETLTDIYAWFTQRNHPDTRRLHAAIRDQLLDRKIVIE